jgi:glycosyltransferase involved in cell wall biosynthesis
VAEPTLSAVVTCYKDAQAIPLMHQRLTAVFASLGVGYEIIFVNDGSPDDTDSVLAALTAKDEHVLAIEHSRNFGSQSAFVSGMQLASGDAVVLLDGDLQDPPELIHEFYAKWREGYDVVYGRRRRREGSALLGLLVALFYRIFRAFSYVPVPLDAGDFALMNRRVTNELLALPETDQFLRGLRAWVGFRQTGVDYVRPKRAFGRSTHGFMKNFWWARKGVFSFTFAPIEALGYVAVVLTLLSSCALVHRLVDVVRHPELAHGGSMIAVLVAFFGSLNLLAVAVVGEYLIKVFEETKRRPKFIRKAIRYRTARLIAPEDIERFASKRASETTRRSRTRAAFDGDEA